MEPNNNNSNKRITWNEQDFPVPEKPDIGIEFYNVNSGETRKCDNEALITAFYNSSNLHANAMVGQDMGWRLAKETIRRMRNIQDDEDELERIVRRFRLNDETEITDSHILTYMFQRDIKRKQKSETQKQNAHLAKYEKDLQDLDLEDNVEEDDEDEDVDQPQGPRRTTATAAPLRRLTPEQAKLLADAKRREENLAAGRDINDGIEMPADLNANDDLDDDTSNEDEEAELARMQAEEDAAKAAAEKKKAEAKKPVAKPRTNSDNES